MKKNLFLTLVVLAVGILIASMVTAQTARVAVPYAVEPLTGAAEFPGPGDTDGTGTAAVTIDVDTDNVCLTVSALANVATPLTGAHIHVGAAGASGNVVVDFAVDAADVVPFTLCVTDTDGDTVAADPAGFYVNLHNGEFVNGAVRGQLVAPVITPTETATEGTPAPTASPTSIAPVAGELVVNGGFETELTGWTLKNAAGDKVKCNKNDKVFAFEGNCGFKFKGGANENSGLQQSPDITALVFGVSDTLDMSAYVGAKKDTADGKFKVIVKYSDLTEASKETVVIAQTLDGVYTQVTGQVTLASAAVSKIKVLVKNTSPDGKFYVDAVSVALVDQLDPTATATLDVTVAATETATVVAATETATTVAATETATTVAATETATTVPPVSDLVPLP